MISPRQCAFVGLAHWNDRQNIPLYDFPNTVSVIASAGQQGTRRWQIVGHDQIEAGIVGGLPRGNLRPHGQPFCIDEAVDLAREAATRTAKTLSPSPGF